MASHYSYTDFGSSFGDSFVQGLLGMMRIGLERDKLDAETELKNQDFTLRRAADQRAAETHAQDLARSQWAFNETQQLPGDIASIYSGAAGTPDTPAVAPIRDYTNPGYSLDDLAPGAPAIPGRPAASTYGDLIQRGVSPEAISRAQRLAPGSLGPLGLQTPEQAADLKRKDQARADVVSLIQQPMPQDLEEQGHRLGQITGAMFRGGFLTGPDAVKQIQQAWQDDPGAMASFFGRVKGYMDQNPPASPGLNGTVASMRDAIARALSDDPSILIKNPPLVKALGLDQLLKSGAAERVPKTLTFAPKDSAGYVDDQGEFHAIPQPAGGGGGGAGGRPIAIPGGGSAAVPGPNGWTVIPGTPKEPKDRFAAMAEQTAASRWPGNDQQAMLAREVYVEYLSRWHSSKPMLLKAEDLTPDVLTPPITQAIDAAERAAYPEKFAGQPQAAPPQPRGIVQTIREFFSGLSVAPVPPVSAPGAALPGQNTSQAIPRGRPIPETTAAAPSLPGPAPGIGADATMTPRTVVTPTGPQGPTPGGPVQVSPPPPTRNYPPELAQAEFRRLVQAGVPPDRARAMMKAGGW